MADFPRVKYKVIDGRSVPFTEPQHFTGVGDEVVRTGESNPLPTKDAAVEARLESIEQAQSQILAKLNDTIDTRLTGSIDEYALPTKSMGVRVEEHAVFDRMIRNHTTGQNEAYEWVRLPVPFEVKRVVVVCNIHSVTGTFDTGEGYQFAVTREMRVGIQSYSPASSDYSTRTGNNSGAIFEIGSEVNEYSFMDNKYQGVSSSLFPSMRVFLWKKGTFQEGEGFDCDATAYFIY